MINQLKNKLLSCTKCPNVEKNSNVFFDGDFNSKIIYFAQNPGRKEVEEGKPLVFRAGFNIKNNLDFNNIIWANVVNCKTYKNRIPHIEEINNCKEYIEEFIDIIKPKLIIIAGAVSLKSFFPNEIFSEIIDNILVKGEIIYYVMYHPAKIIYSPELKETFLTQCKALNEMAGML